MAQRTGKRPSRSATSGSCGGPRPVGQRELVVMVAPQARLRASARGRSAAPGVEVKSIVSVLEQAHAAMRPLFGESEERLRELAAWFVQLWAESLGKRLDRRGQLIFAGPTPTPTR